MLNYLSILVENQAGVLVRVAALFSRRNFNIHSLAVGTTNDPNISRITAVVDAVPNRLEQIISQISKLPVVKAVQRLDNDSCLKRGLALIKININDDNRLNLLKIAETFRANVVDLHPNSIIIEITGSHDKLNAFVNAVEHFGIIEFVQTGIIALNRLDPISFNLHKNFFHKNLF